MSSHKQTQRLLDIREEAKEKEKTENNLEIYVNGIINSSEDIQFSEDLSSIHLQTKNNNNLSFDIIF